MENKEVDWFGIGFGCTQAPTKEIAPIDDFLKGFYGKNDVIEVEQTEEDKAWLAGFNGTKINIDDEGDNDHE